MNHAEIRDLCEQAIMRVGVVYHLGAVLAHDMPDELYEEISDNWWDVRRVLGLDERFDEEPDDDAAEREEIREALMDAGRLGWLVRIETPVPRQISQSGFSYTWGRYLVRWFYAESFEDGLADAAAWVEDNRRRHRVATSALGGLPT